MPDINIKWLIIGGIVIVLLIAFGRNPVDEAQKRYELSKKGKDALMQSIEEHNAKNGRGTFGVGTGAPYFAPVYTTPSYMMRSPQNPYTQPAQPNPPASDGYYPPVVPNSAGPQSNLGAGKPVIFAGTSVFTQDKTGKTVPMPDGVYPLYDGQAKLVVQGGRHVVISN